MTTDLPVSRTGATDREVEALTGDEEYLLHLIDMAPGIDLGGLNARSGLPVHRHSRAFTHLMSRKVIDLSHDQKVARIRGARSGAHPVGAIDELERRDFLARWLEVETLDSDGCMWLRPDSLLAADRILALLAEQPGGRR